MARGDAAKKARWSAYVNGKLREIESNPADLSRRTGIPNKTIYNWTLGDGVASAENCLILAVAFAVPASEVLEASGYPLLADAMEGKELRLVGAPPAAPDPGIMRIMAAEDLTDEAKAIMIKWWRERSAEEEKRRLADAEREIAIRRGSA